MCPHGGSSEPSRRGWLFKKSVLENFRERRGKRETDRQIDRRQIIDVGEKHPSVAFCTFPVRGIDPANLGYVG